MKLICLECGNNYHVEVANGDGFAPPVRHGACSICGEDRSLYLALGKRDDVIDALAGAGAPEAFQHNYGSPE